MNGLYSLYNRQYMYATIIVRKLLYILYTRYILQH